MSSFDTENVETRKPFDSYYAANDFQGGLYRNTLKRFFDCSLVLISALVALPIIGILAALVALDGGNPFYVQERVGKNGRHYKMWKLRSMVFNADSLLEEYLATNSEALAEWTSKQKLTNDPRITRFGHFIRKTSLDELPQLWNVLIGDMSLVGPRPMMPSQKEQYPGTDYYELRPGITGKWQVSSRNESTFADRAKFDADYNREISFLNDLGLLRKTVQVVLKGTGC
ncbi:sugar transferase [Parasedimentitalea huanghaiensis]|uniref:Sugar transferase n=1 Tax=Parasedimentitalea huanghaiensis TaxID=2682100 RepID=A0A6L6WNE7_9RHOB|nr:sugar transferase [Zongyanglinia huanghaiensis]MVO18569.1 sugar transferase [Zongyanglinia huanghaiensis]